MKFCVILKMYNIIILMAMLFSYIASGTAQEDSLGESNSSSRVLGELSR